MKRLFDLILLICAAPLWVLVIFFCYILNILFEGFPGFYSSSRQIANNKNITVFKFRVMKKKIDKKLNRSTVSISDQIFFNLPTNKKIYTSFGLVLERLGITELPQFFSVLKGDMSIVGARPLPDDVFKELKLKYPKIAEARYKSKCGLTGLPQMVGRDNLADEDRLALEGSYSEWTISDYNCIVDFKILLFTILIVLGFKKKLSLDQAHRIIK